MKNVNTCAEKTDNREQCAFLSATCVEKFKSLNKMSAVLNDCKVEVLIDTGSSVNAISSDLVESINCNLLPLSTTDYIS